MDLNNRQIVGLYLFLRKTETELDTEMKHLLHKLEGYIFQRISIQEIELLDTIYGEGKDVLERPC